ncbi:MAG: NAD-dependent epimerase/dehydratase family protein [Acidimicrobiales bacterium]
MKVLVTGGTSLLGAAVIDRLRARGDRVTTLQRNPGSSADSEVLGDVADASAVAEAVADQQAIIHLAAKVAATGPWAEYERTNVIGTQVVLDAAQRAGAQRFVYVSSPSVAHGGEAIIGGRAEPANPDKTRGHYATSKAHAERYALNASSTELPVVAIRPHLVWGPGDTQLVGRIVERACQGRLAIVGSGCALIDSTYVDNAADALVAAVDRVPDVAGEAFVVSNGQPRTVNELIARIVHAAGIAPPRARVPARFAFVGGLAVEQIWERTDRQDDPPMTSFLAEQLSTAHWFDQRRTREALQWQPLVGLDAGFERLESWFRDRTA